MNILVLSPHRDDAAFSLSISIDHWLASGHCVTILNVFTQSLYAPYSDADSVPGKQRIAYVSDLRKREDGEFLRQLPGLTMIDLALEDAPLRLNCDISMVCDMPAYPQDAAIPKIREALEHETKLHHASSALVLPLALGNHIDHRVARDASLSFIAKLPCAFYEDLPYATREGAGADLSQFRKDVAETLHESLLPVLCHGTHARPSFFKLRAARIYESQIDLALAETIASFSWRYQGAERLWANERWISLAGLDSLSIRQEDTEAKPLRTD